MFSLFKKREFFTHSEKERVIEAIRLAENRTSGEIRIFIESRCRFVDPLDRAAEIFWSLKMEQTKEKNAVLVYMAYKDRQLAIMGDEGIHKKVGAEFWNNEVKQMLSRFSKHDYADGIISIINDIGNALHEHFPYNRETDKNELPDDIIFGA